MTKGLAGEVQMSGRRRLPRKGPPSVCRDVAIGDSLIVAFVGTATEAMVTAISVYRTRAVM